MLYIIYHVSNESNYEAALHLIVFSPHTLFRNRPGRVINVGHRYTDHQKIELPLRQFTTTDIGTNNIITNLIVITRYCDKII